MGSVKAFDVAATPVRAINQFLHGNLGGVTNVTIDNPDLSLIHI